LATQNLQEEDVDDGPVVKLSDAEQSTVAQAAAAEKMTDAINSILQAADELAAKDTHDPQLVELYRVRVRVRVREREREGGPTSAR
jgi:Na+/phosphate symporter